MKQIALRKWLLLAGVASLLAAAPADAAPIPAGWLCSGNCGTSGPDGVVTSPPSLGPNYQYITTAGQPNLGVANPGSLGLGGERSGSRLDTSVFTVASGDSLGFFFNYVTSDGAGFADYAFVRLLNLTAKTSDVLFTGRTIAAGNTVPGVGLPGIAPGVTLNPTSTAIIPGGPVWSLLGGDSGRCFSAGCGYTGWIQMNYTLPTPGNYQLQFGVTNWIDTDFASGLAIAGATINDREIVQVPASMAISLFGVGLLALGAVVRRRA